MSDYAAWIHYALGRSERISWEPDQLVADEAAAALAIDGTVSWPRVEVKSWAPVRQAEVDWTIARVALATGRDHGEVDRAFASVTAASDAKRERVLHWAAFELQARRDPRVAQWIAPSQHLDVRTEVAANEVRLLAEAGDFARAGQVLSTLPPLWMLHSDPSYWHGYPRWIGSAAAAVACAVALPTVAADPRARGLVGIAAHACTQITEDWRRNRELRCLALAWARCGDLRRALAATSHMPGSERGRVIAALLDDFGDASGVALAELEPLARAAIAAPRGEPIVISDRDRFEPPDEAERAARGDFVDQVVTAEVVAAIARRHVVAGNAAAAEASIASIDDGFSLYHEAQLQLACVRHARGELDLADVVDGIGANPFGANLISAAMRVDGVEVAGTLARSVRNGGRIASNVAHELVDQGRLDAARALARIAWVEIVAIDRAELQALLVGAFARAGRWADAIALLQTRHGAAIPERVVIAAGFRLVVAMVLAGIGEPARELREALRQRLRTAPR